MDYRISTTKRNLMIISALFLTIYTISNAFFLFHLKPGGPKPELEFMVIKSLLFSIAYIYVLFILFDYFRFHGWKALKYILLFLLIFEIITKAGNVINQIGSFMPFNFNVSMVIGCIWVIAILIQAIFLFRIKRQEYPTIFPLQKYAAGIILTQIIAFLIPTFLHSESFSSMMLVIRIIASLPYLFLVEFALKLDTGKGNITSDVAV